ncbi:hypothetical protein HGH93_00505 [Chitinophaga polysaccharea]|uniref:hypothetical protein n=1 Tax=Chitinophaga polysaccharea TaxID=1293035 RepID=UPI001454F39D|nr:hypothetical protein [Chitinophaga polysaccharea]NLR56559.1 hypothetical protein [Chitinophaga polysaccharea]
MQHRFSEYTVEDARIEKFHKKEKRIFSPRRKAAKDLLLLKCFASLRLGGKKLAAER